MDLLKAVGSVTNTTGTADVEVEVDVEIKAVAEVVSVCDAAAALVGDSRPVAVVLAVDGGGGGSSAAGALAGVVLR
jgi:hypothetical protein